MSFRGSSGSLPFRRVGLGLAVARGSTAFLGFLAIGVFLRDIFGEVGDIEMGSEGSTAVGIGLRGLRIFGVDTLSSDVTCDSFSFFVAARALAAFKILSTASSNARAFGDSAVEKSAGSRGLTEAEFTAEVSFVEFVSEQRLGVLWKDRNKAFEGRK